MRKLLLLLFVVLSYTTVFSQYKIDNLTMNYGEEITDEKGKLVKIIGEANNKIYALGLKGKSDYFLKIFESKGMKLVSNNPIVLPSIKDKDLNFEELVLLNNKLYVIGNVYNRKEKIFTLAGIAFSEDGVLSTNMITLFESKVANSDDRGGFLFRNNPDENKLLVMHTSIFEKEEMMQYEIKLFDDNLKTVFSNGDKISYDDSKKDYEFTISDFDVNITDDVALVVNESFRDKKAKERVEKFQLFIFKAKNSYKKEIVDINFKDKEVINCSMLSTGKNTIQLVGFYSSVRESGRSNKVLRGIYNATVNLQNNSNDNLKFNEFDYETKVKLIGERKAKKDKDIKPYYGISTIIEKNDGGLIVLSEYRTIYRGQSQGFGPLALTPVTYTSNEIIVTSLKPDGSLEWSNVVAKEQVVAITQVAIGFSMASSSGSFNVSASFSFPLGSLGKGPEYIGAIPIYKDGQLNILFNDNKKNIGVTDIEKIKSLGNFNNAIPTLFVFDSKGQLTRKDPEEIIKNELVIRPGVFYRKNKNELIIYASRKSQDKLGRLFIQ